MIKKKKLDKDKNCGKCAWSTRDTKDLQIKCCLGIIINNTWETTHNCNQYAEIRPEKRKKRMPHIQLDLFIHQKL